MESRRQAGLARRDEMSRHIMLSNLHGVVTELERIGARSGSGDQYLLRYHKTSETMSVILDVSGPSDRMPWIGFRYQDAHWSFIEQSLRRNTD